MSPLLGLVSSELMGLGVRTDEVKEKTLKEEYADVFEDNSASEGRKERNRHLVHRDKFHALREKLKEELDRIEAEHIIAKVEDPAEWVTPIVN